MMTSSESSPGSIFKTRGPLDPVNDSALYAPRPELDHLLRTAQATSLDAYLAILGSRQTGKTTLLYQLRARLRPRGIGVALVDLAITRDQSDEQLYRFVASEIRSELEPNLGRVADRRALALPSHSIEFRRFLLDLARQAHAPRLVILLDEVEAVPAASSDAFFGTFRNIFSSRRKEDEAAFDKYLIVLSGAKELHRLTSSPNSPLNIAERIYLQDLGLDGVRIIAANLARAGIAAPPETAEWLYEYTRGHPYLTQKLCALVEQWHPESVDREILARAARQTLKSDDHLEKMLLQIDADATARELLQQVVAGKPIAFSRLNPAVARLELLGAIRDAGECAIRNPLYHEALRAHFGIPKTPPEPTPRLSLGRTLLLLLAIFLIALNLPFLSVYASDILLARRAENLPVPLATLGGDAIIRYDPILRANSNEPNIVRIEAERLTAPLAVTLKRDTAPDISLEGTARRELKPPSSQERFAITLNQSGWAIPYNPFNPRTEHRQIEIVFASPEGVHSHTVPLDFRVDFYSGFVISAALTLSGAVASLVTVLGNIQKIRDALDRLTQPNQ